MHIDLRAGFKALALLCLELAYCASQTVRRAKFSVFLCKLCEGECLQGACFVSCSSFEGLLESKRSHNTVSEGGWRGAV